MTDPLGQSQVLPYVKELSNHGYEFTLLSFEKKKRYKAEKDIIDKIVKDAGINWVPLFFTAHPPMLAKIYDRWQLLRKASQLCQRDKFDIVHCRSYIAAEGGLSLKKKFGTRFLFDMRGFWADERVDNKQWDLKKPFYRKLYNYYKWKEKKFLLQADGIISLTKAAKDFLLAKEEYRHLSICVIPCCADFKHFDFTTITLEEKEKLRSNLGISTDKRVITYLGSIGGWYMTNEMFRFYKRLLVKHPDFVMLIITKDDRQTVINEAIANGIPANKIYVHYATREEVPCYLGLSDCSIFFIEPSFSKIASSPTKHAELMSMGIPVICNDIGDTGDIIKQTQTGVIVNRFSEQEYDNVIENLTYILSISKEYIRKSAFNFFDLNIGTAKYSAIYSELLTKSIDGNAK